MKPPWTAPWGKDHPGDARLSERLALEAVGRARAPQTHRIEDLLGGRWRADRKFHLPAARAHDFSQVNALPSAAAHDEACPLKHFYKYFEIFQTVAPLDAVCPSNSQEGQRMRVKTQALGAMVAALILVITALVTALPASAASLTEVTGFGTNPTNLRMYLYVPDTVRGQPADPGGRALLHRLRPGLLLRHRVRLAGRPVRVHRHLPVGDPRAATASTSPRRRR